MIRCGYRAYGSGLLVEDTSFNTYTTNAIKNNIDVGVYFYSQALNKEEAIEEANYVLTLVKPYNITYPIAIDVEAIENDSFRQENLSASELTDVIIAFCDTIKAAGYTPLIYSNLLYFMDNVELERLEGYDKWFAGYQTASPYYPYKYAMWQYTNNARIDGISGYVDVNVAYFNYNSSFNYNYGTQASVSGQTQQSLNTAELGIIFNSVNEEVTAKEPVNLRSIPEVSGDIVDVLDNGDIALRTGIGDTGWSRLIYNGNVVYAVTSYLTTDY